MILPSRILLAGFFVAPALGCGGHGGFTTVTGTVSCEGTPLNNGYVTLIPDEGGERASGRIGSDGRFTLTTFSANDGVKLGKYRIRIASYQSEAKMNDPSSGKPAIPDKYFDATTSGLTATIEGSSPQRLELKLTK